jgi:hypothetical protein
MWKGFVKMRETVEKREEKEDDVRCDGKGRRRRKKRRRLKKEKVEKGYEENVK